MGLAVLGGIYVASRGLPSVGFGVAQASSGSAGQQQTQVDTKRVAELTAVVDKDPANKDALFELGETYIQAGRWQESLDWFTKLLAVDPENLHARTDVGTDSYNLGRPDAARTAWEEVARRNPSDPQSHYNLGYLYANSFGTVGDVQAATKEWQRVIELAPGTELAKAAQSGLDLLGKQ